MKSRWILPLLLLGTVFLGESAALGESASIDSAYCESQVVSKVVHHHGYRALKHETPIENVLQILKSDAILTNDKVLPIHMSRGEEGLAFAVLHRSEDRIETSLSSATFVFKLIVLDQVSFHYSTRWMEGEFDRRYSALSREPEFISELLTESTDLGEVVFHEDIPLVFLTAIWVHRGERDSLISQIRAQGIHQVHGIAIESLVRENR